jgi:hypothetical protein
MDASAQLLISLCHRRFLDFADFAIPGNTLEVARGFIEHK